MYALREIEKADIQQIKFSLYLSGKNDLSSLSLHLSQQHQQAIGKNENLFVLFQYHSTQMTPDKG